MKADDYSKITKRPVFRTDTAFTVTGEAVKITHCNDRRNVLGFDPNWFDFSDIRRGGNENANS